MYSKIYHLAADSALIRPNGDSSLNVGAEFFGAELRYVFSVLTRKGQRTKGGEVNFSCVQRTRFNYQASRGRGAALFINPRTKREVVSLVTHLSL